MPWLWLRGCVHENTCEPYTSAGTAAARFQPTAAVAMLRQAPIYRIR